VTRRILILLVVELVAFGGSLAYAATLGPVTVQHVTRFAAASTVPTSSCNGADDYDTWIDASNPTTKHGGNATLRVNAQRPSSALLMFTPCAPANAFIVGATLSLYLDTAPNKQRTHEVHDITSAWSSATTWSTQPSVSGTVAASALTGASGSTTTWDVTSDIQAIVDGRTNDGWEIQDNGSGNGNALYDSLEGATQIPNLSITYYP